MKVCWAKTTKITFFYDTTELVWLNYSLLRWVQTFPRTRSEYTTKFDFCTRGVTQKNKPCIFVLFQYLRLGRVFIFASWVNKAHNSPCGLVVGLIYSLRENKYSPLAQILKLDVKYHGLFFYSMLYSVSEDVPRYVSYHRLESPAFRAIYLCSHPRPS